MKKTVAIVLAVVVALAVVGAGYALWYEWLLFDGAVYTGVLDASWSADGTWDTEPPEKDFSYMSLWMSSDNLMYCEVYNAYPCIDYYGYINLENLGTIPFHTDSYTVANNFPAGTTFEIQIFDNNDVDGDGVFLEDWEGWQLHPGDVAWGWVHIHLDNDAEMGTTYTWISDMIVTQWNEGNYGGKILPRP